MLGTRLHHTTAYHPQSNGLIERFHWHLKSALRARLSGPNWIQELPWVLLGIRTAPKEDLGCSSAELVYGAPLTVPGDFSMPNTSDTRLFRQLQQQVRSLVPVPTSQHGTVPFRIPHNLQHAKFVFIRRDAHRSPLQCPYEGPFRVIHPGDKSFQIDIGGKTETISIDRLKLAHTDFEQPVQVYLPRRRGHPLKRKPTTISTPFKCTRSGRTVKPPQRYISVLGGSSVVD